MPTDLSSPPNLTLSHGAHELRCVHIDDYNVELRDDGAFLGDRANKKAFQAILDRWRQGLGEADPLRDVPTQELYKQKPELEKILLRGDPVAAGMLIGAIEEELVAGRTAVLLKRAGEPIALLPIRHHPDAAGLLGSVELAPDRALSAFDGILATDIGGTNIRTGIVELGSEPGSAKIWKSQRWRHADDDPDRDEAVEALIGMLRKLVATAEAEKNFRLAPFVGIACPGVIRPDGTIERGAQNLPGDWESEEFNLPERIVWAIPQIGGKDTAVVMHNDAVVQGLSEACFLRDTARWGILTIGTGLGNAHFTNRERAGTA